MSLGQVLALPETVSAIVKYGEQCLLCTPRNHEVPHKHKALLAFTITACVVCLPSGGNEKAAQLPLKKPNFPLSLQSFIEEEAAFFSIWDPVAGRG